MEQKQQLLAFYNRNVTEYEYTIWDGQVEGFIHHAGKIWGLQDKEKPCQALDRV